VRRPGRGAPALAALAALVLAAFAPALSPQRVFFQRDILAYWYPGMAAFRAAAAEGSWPLWNPWSGFGAPLLADASFQLAYPPTWLALLVPLETQFKLFAVGHALWAALGAALLARALGLRWVAAASGGAAFAAGGPFLSALSLFHHYASAAWLPWVLFGLERLLARPGIGRALPLGALAGGMLLAGSGDMCLAAALMGGARLALRVIRWRSSPAEAGRLLVYAVAAVALAAAIGAAQWLPTLAHAADGFRGDLDARTRAYWSTHPLSLLDLAVPRLVSGAELDTSWRLRLFEGREPMLDCLYLGVVPLALAGLALAQRARGSAALAGGLAFLLVLSLGRFTPVYDWLSHLPGLAQMRYPQKFLLAASFAFALLAASGAERWLSPWGEGARRRGRVLAGGLLGVGLTFALAAAWASLALADRPAGLRLVRSAVGLTVAAVLLDRRAARQSAPTALSFALLAAGALDLVGVTSRANPLAPREIATRRPAVLDELGSGPVRVFAPAPEATCRLTAAGAPGWSPEAVAAHAFAEALRPPSGARWGVFGSFDGEFTGLGSRWTASFTAAAWSKAGTAEGTRLLRAAAVNHVVRVAATDLPGLGASRVRPSAQVCPIRVQDVPSPRPRTWVAGVERQAGTAEEVLRQLLDPRFDAEREVVITSDAAPVARPEAPGLVAEARVVGRTTGTVDVEARLDGAGTLVLAEAWAPGWKVDVDGRPAPLLRANGLFRGVRLAAGAHRVRFEYAPRSASWGRALSLAGLLAAALGLAACRRRRGLPVADGRRTIAAGDAP
jgi:hypothetical protein